MWTLSDQIQAELEELRSKNANLKQIEEERDREHKRLNDLVEASQARESQLQADVQAKLEAEQQRVNDITQQLAHANQAKDQLQQSCFEKDEQIKKDQAQAQQAKLDYEQLQNQINELQLEATKKERAHKNELASMQLEIDHHQLEKSKVEVLLE